MLVLVMSLFVQGDIPQIGAPNPRPAFECAEHVTDARARRSCLNTLLREAETQLQAAQEQAREEARDSDLDSGGMFQAEASLDNAQAIWMQYRDAECARRGSLMFVSESSREEIVLDCRIALDRARAAELLEH
ncbi:lysozyme inhibitor LprI family protein [Maricaulis sp.]|uniref:lysozyme inhibitor LprI family protein n=1 Tax=Maricaulis sp. TaxID=1486257 RepID=UPI003A90E47D